MNDIDIKSNASSVHLDRGFPLEEERYPDDDHLNGTIHRIFAAHADRRTSEERRVKIMENSHLIYHTSRGFRTGLGITPSKKAARLNHLFVDMKDAILLKKGIQPDAVKDFRIQLHTRTCSFTHPDTNKKVILDLHEVFVGDADGEELNNAYFETAGHFYTPTYKFSKGQKGALNGKEQLSPNQEIVKKHGYVTGNNGFKTGAQLLASHLIAYKEDPKLRKQIAERHAFASNIHKNTLTHLNPLIEAKKQKLEDLKKEEPIDQKKVADLTKDYNHLVRFQTELQKLDYFSVNWALCEFPYVEPGDGSETMEQIEDSLFEQIQKNAKVMESDLRKYQHIGKEENVKKDPKEAALEEEYIRDNCAGLLFLTRSGQLRRCQELGIEKMKQESIEDVFMKEIVRYSNSSLDHRLGQSFKDYMRPYLSVEAREELNQVLTKAVDQTVQFMAALPAAPDFNAVKVPANDQELDAAKEAIATAIIAYEEPEIIG